MSKIKRLGKSTPWYFSTPFKIISFLFLTPVWSLIVIADPGSGIPVKIVGVLVLLLYVLFVCVPASGNFLAGT